MKIVRTKVTKYPHNGAMAVLASIDWDDGDSLESTPISVNVEGAENLPDGLFLAKNYSEGEELYRLAVEGGFILPVTDDDGKNITFPSGYVDLPLCKLGPNSL